LPNLVGWFKPYGGGPWVGDMSIPDIIKKTRKDMLECGTEMCPDRCIVKRILKDCTARERMYHMYYKKGLVSFDLCNKFTKVINDGDIDCDLNPINITYSPSYFCNQNCSFCCVDIDNSKNSRFFPTEKEIENVRKFHENCSTYTLTGGEFMAFPDNIIRKLIEPISMKNSRVSLKTNGRALTLKRYEDYCVNGPISDVSISINSLDPGVYYLLHGKELDPILKNIYDIYSKYNNHKITIVSFVINQYNIYEIPDFVRFALKYNIKWVSFGCMINRYLEKRNAKDLDIFGEGFRIEFKDLIIDIEREIKEILKNEEMTYDSLYTFHVLRDQILGVNR